MNHLKHYGIIWGIVVVGIFVLLTVFGFMYKDKSKAYKELEEKLVSAEKKYVDAKFLYPEENNTLKTSASELITSGFMEELNENGFQKALMSVQHMLPGEAMEILLPFAKRLGGGDREAETALCLRTAALLSELCEKLREKLPEKTKMYRALPLLCALSAVILII